MPPPSEEDLISYSYFKSYFTKSNSIEESLLKSNKSKDVIFAKVARSNFYIMPYSWNILHIVAIDGNDTFIKHMPAYEDFKISFLLDRYGKTPSLSHSSRENHVFLCEYHVDLHL